jgi:hypothetical protein
MVMNNYQNMNNQNEKIFKKASDEAVNLRIAEKILAEIERRLLMNAPSLFEIDKIKDLLQQLKSLSQESAPDEIFNVEFLVNQEFHFWRNLLENRDQNIETYHLRRFFDLTAENLNVAVFIALTQFYRNLTLTPVNLSKFDLVVTRLFMKKIGNYKREPRLNRREMTRTLNELFNDWDGNIKYSSKFSTEVIETVAEIDHFIAEAQSLQDFEELTKANLFERLRTFKRSIGKLFFEPLVIAAAVECNLTLGNVFNRLMTKANENLSSRLNSRFDFVGAFQDTSPTAQIRVSEIFQEIRTDQSFDLQVQENEDFPHILELLQFVGGETSGTNQSSENEFFINADEYCQTAGERIYDVLKTLSEPLPNVNLLRDYTRKSKHLWTLDLNDFINSENEEINQICREVLSVILLMDELCNHELNQNTEISSDTLDEATGVLKKSQNLAEKLDELLENTENNAQYRLLIVSNKLLETRLKFERAIVRLGNRHLGLTKENPTEISDLDKTEIVQETGSNVIRLDVKGWQIAATLLVAVFSGCLYFFSQHLDNALPIAQDAEEINISTLPNNEFLAAAFRQKETLFITSKESWEKLPQVQKKQQLEALLSIPAITKLSSVVVTDAEGQPLGDISPEGIHFPDEILED